MAEYTFADIMAAVDGQSTEPAPEEFSFADIMSAVESQSNEFRPVVSPARSREQEQRASRLAIIRKQAQAGEEVDFGELPLTTDQLAQRSTIRVGDAQVAAGGSAFADTPLLGRAAILGGAALGAVIEDPILRLRGRGDLADQNWRNWNNMMEYSRRLAQEGQLGETAGTLLHDVATSLATGTLAAPFGGTGATGNLAASATAFGLQGADNAYVEAKDAGLSQGQAMGAWGRQFLIDGALTFAGGKLIQNMGLNPGRYFGNSLGKAAQIAAERSGAARVLGSAAADAGMEGVQGALGYLNQTYTGTQDFSWDGLWDSFKMSALAGGVAGAATSGVQVAGEQVSRQQEFKVAVENFQKELPKAVEGIRAANEFAATATPEQMQKARDATTVKEFAEATGTKGKGTTHREAFQAELSDLDNIQAELDARSGVQTQSLIRRDADLAARREELATHDETIARLKQEIRDMTTPAKPPEGAPVRPGPVSMESIVKKRAELMFRENEAAPLRKEIEAEAEAIRAARDAIKGEAVEHRAYLESQIDRIIAEEAGAAKTPGSQKAERDGIDQTAFEPPVRQRTPPTFAQRYERIGGAIEAAGKVSNMARAEQPIDAATRRDMSKLVRRYVKGEERAAALQQKIMQANTPGKMAKAMESLGKHIHTAEVKVAEQDYNDAVKKAVNLRPEQAAEVAALMPTKDGKKKKKASGVNFDSVDSLRDAAEAIRTAAYQSAMADVRMRDENAESISGTATTVIDETVNAREMEKKSRSFLRKVFGRNQIGHKKSREPFSLDSPVLREWATRLEVLVDRVSPTLHDMIFNKAGVEDYGRYMLHQKEATQGLSDVLDSVGLTHGATLDDTLNNIASGGRGTALEAWRSDTRRIGGVELTRGEASILSLFLRDPRNQQAMEKHGWDFQDDRKIAKVDDRIRNQIDEFVGDQGRPVVDWMFRYLNGPLIHRVNDTWKISTGRPLTEHFDVVPRNQTDTWELVGGTPSRALRDATMTGYKHLKHREEASEALTVPPGTADAFSYFLNHVDRMNRVADFTLSARDIQGVLNSPGVREAYVAKDGIEGWENLQEALSFFFNGPRGIDPKIRPLLKRGLRAVARLSGISAASKLALRFSTMAVQGANIPVAAAYDENGLADLAAWAAGRVNIPEVQARERRMNALLGEHSGVFWARNNPQSYATESTGGMYQQVGWFQPPSLVQHGLRPMNRVEQLSVWDAHFHAAERAAARAGIRPDSPQYGPWVARYWERRMMRGESGSHGLEMPGILRAGRENPLIGAVTQFMNAASKSWSLLPKAFDHFDKGQLRPATATLAAIAASTMIAALVKRAASFRERDEDQSFLEAAGDQAILEMAGWHPLGQVSLVPVVRALTNMKRQSSAPVLAQDVNDLVTASIEFGKGVMQEAEETDDPESHFERGLKALIPLGSLLGVPIEGLADLRRRVTAGSLLPGIDQPEEE